MSRAAWIALAAALALGACGTPRMTYERAGASPAQVDRDFEHCRREAFRPERFAIRLADRVDWEVLTRCMQRRGYTARPAD
jgi:hypothetical protein